MWQKKSIKGIKHFFIYLTIALVTLLGSFYLLSFPHDTRQDDIFYLWKEGQRISAGQNPYARILNNNPQDQDQGWAIYFPLFYLLSSLSQNLGLKTYDLWIQFWQPVFLLFNLGITMLIFDQLYKQKSILIAFLGSLFWLFNRYTIHGYQAAYLDFMAIFFLLFSLKIFQKYPRLSLFIYSLSLAIKQMAIFLLPLYLIWIWQKTKQKKIKNTFLAFLIIILLPVLLSLPFFMLNPQAFCKSILYSVSRNPYYFGTISFDAQIGLRGWQAKIPMFFLMILVYEGVRKKKIPFYFSILLIMLIFVNFNSVLFIQQLCWVLVFVPLCLLDFQNTSSLQPRNKKS